MWKPGNELFTIDGLAALDAPPPLLYVKGNAALLQRPIIGIVGARQCSAAGAKLARQFAAEIGRGGYVIASGLARGIDAMAHLAALDTGTIAVLAGGLDVVYPNLLALVALASLLVAFSAWRFRRQLG